MENSSISQKFGNISLYPNQLLVSEEEKQSVINYSRLFDFDLEVENLLKAEGVEISKASIQKEITVYHNNHALDCLDTFESGYYESDKASDRITNNIKDWKINKYFMSNECRKAIIITKQNIKNGIENDISSALNPTLDKLQSKMLLQNQEFVGLVDKINEAKKRYSKNYNTKDKKQIQEYKEKAIQFLN